MVGRRRRESSRVAINRRQSIEHMSVPQHMCRDFRPKGPDSNPSSFTRNRTKKNTYKVNNVVHDNH
jgi:hypothetical protein